MLKYEKMKIMIMYTLEKYCMLLNDQEKYRKEIREIIVYKIIITKQ